MGSVARSRTQAQEGRSLELVRRRVRVTGLVQGVGFRPYVYRLATEAGLAGWVLNSPAGVVIEVEGPADLVQAFVDRLAAQPPRLARVADLSTESVDPQGDREFVIVGSSDTGGRRTLVAPDVATCQACRAEVTDPGNRRYHYPFTNCTDCGPRYTIIRDLPYDRPFTSMAAFTLCPDCRREYEDPADRRFHAQPNACPVCGPHLRFIGVAAGSSDGRVNPPLSRDGAPDREALTQFREVIALGGVVAVKGLGGFHLVCDARSEPAVARLRSRKHRPDKPLAVMARDLTAARRYVRIGPEAERWLTSPEAPIVVLPAIPGSGAAAALARGTRTLGVMLPYTPLHALLFDDQLDLLVMTSANRGGLPIITDNAAAQSDLGDIADAFLLHDRDIVNRCEDSVVRVVEGGAGPPLTVFYRRSRGFAPAPLDLGSSLPPGFELPVLGAGAEMKSTFCLVRGTQAFLSPHLGELDSVESLDAYADTYRHYRAWLDLAPQRVAVDPHPGYLVTRSARQLAQAEGLPVHPVFHHHAHLVACMADNGLPGDREVLGLVADGTGYGTDGAIWGLELLAGSARSFRRLGHLDYIRLPGGDAAARRPYRAAAAHLYRALGPIGVERLARLRPTLRAELDFCLGWLETAAPSAAVRCSSAGRLFDAVAALVGISAENTYEGQAAIELSDVLDVDDATAIALGRPPEPTHRFAVFDAPEGEGELILDPGPHLGALLEGIEAGRYGAPEVSFRFHQALAHAMADAAIRLAHRERCPRVCLSGGTFQNPLLVRVVAGLLTEAGLTVYRHQNLPPGDGGLSLGQAVAAAWQDGI